MGTTKATTKATKATKADTTRKAIHLPEGITVQRVEDAYGHTKDQSIDQVRIAAAFVAARVSQNGAIAAVIKANRGRAVKGWTSGAVSRIFPVAQETLRDDLPKMTASQGERATLALLSLSTVSTVPELRAAHDLALKETTAGRYVTALQGAATTAHANHYKGLTATGKPKRRAIDKGKATNADNGKRETESKASGERVTAAATLASASTSDLIAALASRFAKGVHADDLDAFNAVVATVEDHVAADRVAAKRKG